MDCGKRRACERGDAVTADQLTALRASDDALHVTPEVSEAAASDRAEIEIRYDRVRELFREWRRAADAHHAWHVRNRELKYEPESEPWIRAQIEKDRLGRAAVAAERAYHAACDAFFDNSHSRPIYVAFGARR
jgi:hypothetical protein